MPGHWCLSPSRCGSRVACSIPSSFLGQLDNDRGIRKDEPTSRDGGNATTGYPQHHVYSTIPQKYPPGMAKYAGPAFRITSVVAGMAQMLGVGEAWRHYSKALRQRCGSPTFPVKSGKR